MKAKKRSTFRMVVGRFLVPSFAISAYYFFRYGCKVSPRAEVELSPFLKFGPGCTISSFSKFKATNGPLIMGKRCGFAIGCFISSGEGGIHIGDDFICGPNVSMTANNYIYDRINVPLEEQGTVSKGIRIGNNVWIGAGCTILDGAQIGDNTIVVAGSLINRRYAPNTILQGSPAKVLLKRSAEK